MPRQRPRRVEHLDQPLERQVLVRVGREVRAPHPADQLARSSGRPTVSVRSTRVLTKNPTSSSSAASVRPAIGLPIGMSVPAPSRLSSAASAGLQHHEQARAGARAPAPARPRCSSASMSSGTWPPRWLDTAGRGRSAGSSICSGRSCQRLASSTPAAAPARCRRRPRRPAPPAATACSRRTAPAAAAAPAPRPSRRAR